MGISVVDPISSAINRAKYITFQPFDLGKWFVLGFVAWLGTLGEGGCGGGGGGGNPGRGGRGPVTGTWSPGGTSTASDGFHEFTRWLSDNAGAAVLIGLIVIALILTIVLLIMWINSRGRFMFIEAVANNTYEVVAPWRRYRALGDSLFGFRVVLMIIGFVIAVVVIAPCLWIAWPDIRTEQFGSGAITAIILGAVLWIPLGLILWIVNWCTTEFVAPIMYAGGIPVLPAWSEFRANVVRGHVGSLILFFLMQLVLNIAIAILSFVVGCVTCCLGFLPYLSAVATLPLLVFHRCYSIYFLQQFDPRYVIIREPYPPAAFPVVDPASGQPPWPPTYPNG